MSSLPSLVRIGWLALLAVTSTVGAQEPALEPVAVQLKWTHSFQFAGYYVARERGYYREAGLDVTLLEGLPGVDPVKVVLSGQAQYGVSTSSLLLERLSGKPVVALAVIFQHSPYVLLARRDHPAQSLHDLVGRRLMQEPQSDEITAYLRLEGIPYESLVRLEHSHRPEDLIEGKVEAMTAYVTDEPYYLDLVDFDYQTYTPRSAGIDFYGDNLFTTEEELKRHSRRVEAFRAATLRGWREAMAAPEETADLILRSTSTAHSREFLLYQAARMVPLMRPDLIEVGYMYPGRWQHIAETYSDLGMLPRSVKLDGFLHLPESEGGLKAAYPWIGLALALAAAAGITALVIARKNRLLARILEERKRFDNLKDDMDRISRHDMKTPLVGMIGIPQLLLEEPNLTASQKELLGESIRSGYRLLRMIDLSLDLYKQETGTYTFRPTPVDVVAVLRSVLTNAEGALRQKRLTVALTVDGATVGEEVSVVIPGEELLLYSMFGNLVANAIDASPVGAEIGVVITRGDPCRVELHNLGVVPESLREKFFQKYVTAGKPGGTGLGAYSARLMARTHGGDLEMRSPDRGGTTIMARLPATLGPALT